MKLNLLFLFSILSLASSTVTTVILIGATGNLAQKYLWQSVFNIASYHSSRLSIIAGARDTPDRGLRAINRIIAQNVTATAVAKENFLRDSFFGYHQLKTEEHYKELGRKLNDAFAEGEDNEVGRLVFLAVPPKFYGYIAGMINRHLRPTHPDSWLRVIFEKPFGRNLQSAKLITESTALHLRESEILRIDHYLGKQTIESILPFRIMNQNVLNSLQIDKVRVVMTETEDCKGRTDFYDRYGVIRDVFQNHLMQMLSLGLMKLPSSSSNYSKEEIINMIPLLRRDFVQLASRSAPKLVDMRLGQYNSYIRHFLADKLDWLLRKKNYALPSFAEVYRDVQMNTLHEDDIIAYSNATYAPSVAETPTCATASFESALPTQKDSVKIEMIAGKGFPTREAFLELIFQSPNNGEKPKLRFQIQGKSADNKSISGAGIEALNLPKLSAPPGWKLYSQIIDSVEESDETIRKQIFRPREKAKQAYEVLINAALHNNRNYFVGLEELHESWKFWNDILVDLDHSASSSILERYNAGHADDVCHVTESQRHGGKVLQFLKWFYGGDETKVHRKEAIQREDGVKTLIKPHPFRWLAFAPEKIWKAWSTLLDKNGLEASASDDEREALSSSWQSQIQENLHDFQAFQVLHLFQVHEEL
eukprot:g1067.t1